MLLVSTRDVFRPSFTLSTLAIVCEGMAWAGGGWHADPDTSPRPFGVVIEDVDRGLDATMPIEQLRAAKIAKVTAIPVGEYVVRTTMSARFGVLMPLLLDVPAYRGIRIHKGTNARATEGCMLPGLSRNVGAGTVSRSDVACVWLYARIAECEARGEPVRFRVQRAPGYVLATPQP